MPLKLLVVKLSSLGDVVHTFPAVTDAAASIPDLVVDWAVEEALVPLVRLHPAVRRAIPVPLRRFKKKPREAVRSGALAALRHALAEESYDVVIDAQGLLKSALVAWQARGRRHGFARGSAREALAPLFYQERHVLPEREHMALRIRKLFAASLGYKLAGLPVDAGLKVAPAPADPPYLVFLHGTTWGTKTWTVRHWRGLAELAGRAGLGVRLFAQGESELKRAAAITADLPHVHLQPEGPILSHLPVIAGAEGVVSVDSGLGHLAAALGRPTVGLYGPTNAKLTGLYGPRVLDLTSFRPCTPCEKARCRIAPETVEGPPCLADLQPRDAWRSLNVLRFGHADAVDKGRPGMAQGARRTP